MVESVVSSGGLVLLGPGDGDIHILQSADEFSSIEEIILDLHYPFLLDVLGSVFPAAEATSGPGNRTRHGVSLSARGQVGGDVGRELESIEVPADQSVCVELLHSWEEVAVQSEPPAVAQHQQEEYGLCLSLLLQSTLFFYMEDDHPPTSSKPQQGPQQEKERVQQEREEREGGKSLKLKVGIFFGYNGENFLGLQYQRDTANTIENTLHRVLCENGFILKTNQCNLRRIKWSRAGRTDKRVHALCNGISASLQFDERYIINRQTKAIDLEKATRDINAELPFDIRIFTMKRVGKGFDMRHDAASRVYNYIAPMRLFLHKDHQDRLLNELEREELVGRLNSLCDLYLGTHNFHNFTKGYKQTDPRCDRYMMAMRAEIVEEHVIDRYLEERFASEEERREHRMSFVRFTLVGQSFIYHQIRKMVGLLVKISYQGLPGEETIKLAFGKERYDVYLAPGEGLYLNRMTFQGYNKKKSAELQVELNEEDEARITKYRNYLESKILSHQINEKVFTNWLLNHNAFVDQSEEEKSVNND